jgi:hypothetical protein
MATCTKKCIFRHPFELLSSIPKVPGVDKPSGLLSEICTACLGLIFGIKMRPLEKSQSSCVDGLDSSNCTHTS